jgi:hypothetical protein
MVSFAQITNGETHRTRTSSPGRELPLFILNLYMFLSLATPYNVPSVYCALRVYYFAWVSVFGTQTTQLYLKERLLRYLHKALRWNIVVVLLLSVLTFVTLVTCPLSNMVCGDRYEAAREKDFFMWSVLRGTSFLTLVHICISALSYTLIRIYKVSLLSDQPFEKACSTGE